MLDSRIAQTGVMVGVMGLLFGMAMAPVPNVASEYILGGLMQDMDFHYDRHQAAFEAYQLTSSPSTANYKVKDYQIQIAVDNPDDCENDAGDYFQFENSIIDGGNCVEYSGSEYDTGYYAGGGMTYQPAITDSPPRISFYVQDVGPNSMYIELGENHG